MDFVICRYFVSVAEALRFTKAAQKLHTAQLSLSWWTKDLENEIGVRLLSRATSSYQPSSYLSPHSFLLCSGDSSPDC